MKIRFINTPTITTEVGKRVYGFVIPQPSCIVNRILNLFTHHSPTKHSLSDLRFFFLSKSVSGILTLLLCSPKVYPVKKVCRTCGNYNINLCYCEKKKLVTPYEHSCERWVKKVLDEDRILVAEKSSHQL
jgi:hypothetical protein